jgi:hypothetical protein
VFEDNDDNPQERASSPADAAREKFDQFRMHAELVAVFEGVRKFDAQLRTDLSLEDARDIQKQIAMLEKAKAADSPLIQPNSMPAAAELLKLPETRGLATNDYHIHRRPGEAMIVRFLAGEDDVNAFYERFQAHFEAALTQFREEERHAKAWKQDDETSKYLDALDKIEVKMEDRYLREIIRKHRVFILSTQTADEMDILHLCDYVMGVDAAAVVGRASAPPEEDATERDRAWFFKLFSLRGIVEGAERMCFFTFLQKTEDTFGADWSA